jgi:hypothetical protein
LNKIVNEHVKASEIPRRFREGIDDSALVTIVVQQERSESEQSSRAGLSDLIEQARRGAKGITTEEAVKRIRSLRDEWDD